MRVVLDTNVLVSGIFFTGSPAQVLAAWAGGRFELLASVEILAEYRRVGTRLGSKYAAVDANSATRFRVICSRRLQPSSAPSGPVFALFSQIPAVG